jgi:uncharacterized membrane protein YeaQ/YmgE (transglycosylase-associated protein family)
VEHMGIIAWIVLGLVAGFIASKVINKSGGGLITDCILGIVGGVVGGFIVDRVPALANLFGHANILGFALGPLIIAVLGAVLVLLVYHMVFRRGA